MLPRRSVAGNYRNASFNNGLSRDGQPRALQSRGETADRTVCGKSDGRVRRRKLPVWESFFTGRTHPFVSFMVNGKAPTHLESVKINWTRNVLNS